MGSKKTRIELHCHSVYSERDGVSAVRDLITVADRLGISGMAFTDHNSVAGYGEAMYYSRQISGFQMIYGMEGIVVDDIDANRNAEYNKIVSTYHVSFLIRNEIGKQNLFRLITKSNFQCKGKQSVIPWSEIEKHREGLLIGSACSAGQLYNLIRTDATEEELHRIAKRYDYLEVQPADSKLFLIKNACDYDAAIAKIQEYDRKVVDIGARLGIPVVATGNVHFATEEESSVRAIIQCYLGNENDEQYALQIRSTEEMLEAFSYLGKEKAYEIVVENTHRIAEQIEEFEVLPTELKKYYPILDNAYEKLSEICFQRLQEIYGNTIDQSILNILDWELNGLRESGSDSIMLLAKELVNETGLSPYEFGYRGTLGGLLTAYLCGLTCINPLEAKLLLYPEFVIGIEGDKEVDIDFNYPFKFRDKVQELCAELEEVGDSFHSATVETMSDWEAYSAVDEYEFYHAIEYTQEKREWLLNRLRNVIWKHCEQPEGNVLVPEGCEISEFTPLENLNHEVSMVSYHDLDGYLYKFDVLTNDSVEMVYRLMKRTGVNVKDISLDDEDVAKMFSDRTVWNGEEKEGMDAIGVPEFQTQYMYILACQMGVDSFTDVVKVIALAHGTGVWHGNAEDLLKDGIYTKDSILATREDIFECLLVLGFCREEAFAIAEFVRKGKASYSHSEKWDKWKQKIMEAGAPEWFVWSCEQIKYMFPRAHAYRYALDAWWCAWFKFHYPKEFYQVYFELCKNRNLLEVIKKGEEAFKLYKQGYFEGMSSSAGKEDTSGVIIPDFLVAEEMFSRGIQI